MEEGLIKKMIYSTETPEKRVTRQFGFFASVFLSQLGLMVVASWLVRPTPDSGSGGPSSSPGRGHRALFLGRHSSLTVPLSTQVYYWLTAGDNPGMDQHLIEGRLEHSQSLYATNTGISSGIMGRVARVQTLPLPCLVSLLYYSQIVQNSFEYICHLILI